MDIITHIYYQFNIYNLKLIVTNILTKFYMVFFINIYKPKVGNVIQIRSIWGVHQELGGKIVETTKITIQSKFYQIFIIGIKQYKYQENRRVYVLAM